jgi:hypothetical protein
VDIVTEPELTKWEIWVLQVYFDEHGFYRPHDIIQVIHRLDTLSFHEGKAVLKSLIQKNVLSISPDNRQVRITDYGAELYFATVRAQKDWEAQKIIRTATLDRDQILIRAGERFKANRMLREIFASAQKELSILDPYVGPPLFDLLEEHAPRLQIRIVTSERIKPTAISSYMAFRSQYPRSELRVMTEDKLHDRYILWDESHGVHLGHSIKDLGEKDTQVTVLKTPGEQYRLFEERWSESKTLS